MKIKKFSLMATALFVATTLVACGNKEESVTPTPETSEEATKGPKETHLSFGVMSSIDVVPLIVAQEQGYFEEQGVDLDLQIFAAAKDRDAALQAGELDGVLCDEVAISIYQNSDINMQITGTTSGSWTLVATPESGIETLADLKGKSMAISENTMIDYLSDYLATSNGLTVDEIEKIAIPAMPARLEALQNNQVNAAILPTPFNDTAVANGAKEITKIYNEDIMISVTAFLQEVIDENPEAVQGFYKAYNKAVDYIKNTDISEFEDVIIEAANYSDDMRGNIVLPEYPYNYLPAEEKVQNVLDWAKNKGLLTKDITAADVINDIAIQ